MSNAGRYRVIGSAPLRSILAVVLTVLIGVVAAGWSAPSAHGYDLLATSTTSPANIASAITGDAATISAFPRTSAAVLRSFSAAEEGAGGGGRAIVIGEDMEGRVIPTAKELGADFYEPPESPPEEYMENNRRYINDRMDEGCTIYDCGPAPGRANYPDPTSPYYRMELGEIGARGYPTTPVDAATR